jgi:hypothetical protein
MTAISWRFAAPAAAVHARQVALGIDKTFENSHPWTFARVSVPRLECRAFLAGRSKLEF